MELMTSRNRFMVTTVGGVAVEYMYELVLRMAVATESRTFLLFERAQALAHWTILVERREERSCQRLLTHKPQGAQSKQ